MIRQRRIKAHQPKPPLITQNNLFIEGNLMTRPQTKENQVFPQGIFNKFFRLNINNKNPLGYSTKANLNNKSTSGMFVRGQSKPHNSKGGSISFSSNNKDNKQNLLVTGGFESELPQQPHNQSQSKLLLLQTTGNAMVSLRKFTETSTNSNRATNNRRPMTAASSYRGSFHRDNNNNNIQTSISRMLSELSQNNECHNNNNKNPHQEKISTSQALVLYSKVVRTGDKQPSSRQSWKRTLKTSTGERYKSVSIMANRVNIGVKGQQHNGAKTNEKKKKIDFKQYLQKLRGVGQGGKGDKIRREEDFQIGGWDVAEGEGF